jgi:hypothetical protein
MKRTIWLLVGLLVVLHQDYWQWDDTSLCFGFLPYTLAYHAALSLLAAAVWLLAASFFWPHQLEVDTLSELAGDPPATGSAATGNHAASDAEAAAKNKAAGTNGP